MGRTFPLTPLRVLQDPLCENASFGGVCVPQGMGTIIFFTKIADARLVQGIPIYFRQRDDFFYKKMHFCKI